LPLMSFRSILIQASLSGWPSSPFTSPDNEDVWAEAAKEKTTRPARARRVLESFKCISNTFLSSWTVSQMLSILYSMRLIERRADCQQQVPRRERFRDELGAAAQDIVFGNFPAIKTGHVEDAHAGMNSQDSFGEIRAAKSRHDDIREQQMQPSFRIFTDSERLVAAARAQDIVPLPGENRTTQPKHQRLVVDDQNRFRAAGSVKRRLIVSGRPVAQATPHFHLNPSNREGRPIPQRQPTSFRYNGPVCARGLLRCADCAKPAPTEHFKEKKMQAIRNISLLALFALASISPAFSQEARPKRE